jgi:hypothetical protein
MALLSTIPKSGKAFSLTGRSKLELKIVQTLGKGEALAITENYDVVKIESLTELYYDGKRLYGYFTLLDTYTYKTTQGMWKTVPVYVRSREYRKNKGIWDRIHSEDDIDNSCEISINSFYL